MRPRSPGTTPTKPPGRSPTACTRTLRAPTRWAPPIRCPSPRPGVIPESSPVILTTPGTYYWQATYSGDGLNGTSASTCGPDDDAESVYTSSLSLTKSTTSTGYGAAGQSISYSYLVTDTGTTTVSSIGITDNKIAPAGITCAAPSLGPGASETCTGTYTTTQADVAVGSVTNTATATGTNPRAPRSPPTSPR